MRKGKKNKTIKKRYKKCIYTDEAKRIMRNTRRIRMQNKLFLKTMKTNKSNAS